MRDHLQRMGHEFSPIQPQQVEFIATRYLGCDIVSIPNLTDRFAQQYLCSRFGVAPDYYWGDDAPLSGGLYVSRDGLYRWIFVERNESVERRRFTVAHELGHLWLEVITPLAKTRSKRISENQMQYSFGNPRPELHVIGCRDRGVRSAARSLDPRESAANAFAAELLIPTIGLESVVTSLGIGHTGWTSARIDVIADQLARTFAVSRQVARIHLVQHISESR